MKQMDKETLGLIYFATLQIALIILKIAGLINTDWLIVLLPTWIPFAFVLGMAVLVLAFGALAVVINTIRILVSGKHQD